MWFPPKNSERIIIRPVDLEEPMTIVFVPHNPNQGKGWKIPEPPKEDK